MPNGRTAYIAGTRDQDVIPIRTATNTPGQRIDLAGQPGAIAITPNGKTVYVAVNAFVSFFVTPIRTATNKAGRNIKIGAGPWYIAITPDGETAYVAHSRSGTVTPHGTATGTGPRPVRVPDGPPRLAASPDWA